MRDYQREFLAFAIDCGVLRFGEFVLKSGRKSPYFFNSGLFDSGATISRLGEYYARAITASGIEYDMLFGPAYKGIPLVVATAISLHHQAQLNVPFAFNRKEAKDHGEGGITVGAPLQGRVLIVDDVISSGISVSESIAIIEAAGAQPAGVAISLDRQERGEGKRSAIGEIEERYGIPVIGIARLEELLAYLRERGGEEDLVEAIESYRQRYGERL